MNLNYARMSWEEKEELIVQARIHFEFVCKLYRLQHQSGRYFAHEHPRGATSWREKSIGDIKKWVGVECLTIEQCMYGLTTKGNDGHEYAAKKSTTVMTNCPGLAFTLNKRCDGSHKQQQFIGGKRTAESQT